MTGRTEPDVWRSKSLIRFLDGQKRGGPGADETRCAHRNREARGGHVVGQLEDCHHVIFAECDVDALQFFPIDYALHLALDFLPAVKRLT